MKFNKLFLGAAILSMGVLASCSSDDEPAVNSGNDVKGEGYITVKFKTAGIGEGRAEEYEPGSSAEGEVTAANTRFYFFDMEGNAFLMTDAKNVNGTVTPSNMVTPTEVKPGNTPGNTIAEGVLVLGKAVDNGGFQGVLPSKAVCVTNGTKTFMDRLAGMSLEKLATEVTNSTQTSMFMMSSSNYKAALDYGAVTISDKVKATPEDAQKSPVEFYLERLAVKVRIKDGQKTEFISVDKEGNEVKYPIYNVDGSKEEVTLQVKLADWQIVKTTDRAYTIKQIPTADPWEGWSADGYHRSFWAESPDEAQENLYNVTFDIYEPQNSKATAWNTFGTSLYTWEWTNGTAASLNDRSHGATATAVVVRANIQKKNTEGNYENVDLVKWAGTYYLTDAFKYMVANAYNTDHKSVADFVNITSADVELEYDQYLEAINSNYWKVVIKGETYKKFEHIRRWEDGLTSFYINILQHKDGDKNFFGVVRNHVYEYDFTNIVGLGVPGNNPDEEDGETYVAASLNVLDWHIIRNSVTLE